MKCFVQVFVAFALFCMAHSAQAQHNYNTSIGLRVGYTSGVTAKGFLGEQLALEGIVSIPLWSAGGFGVNSILLTGLGEWHFPIRSISGFNWFVGGGLHLGFYNDKNGSGGTYGGVDIIGGLDYTLPSAPFNFQLDFKPAIHVFGGRDKWYGDLALSVRYAF